MATSPLLPSCATFIIFLILTLVYPPATARFAQARSGSDIKLQAKSHRLHRNTPNPLKSSNSLVMRRALMEGDGNRNDREDVLQSSPAQPSTFAALAPLPEFPTLSPPIVWSFPAAPLPPLQQAPPPAEADVPKLPGTGSINAGPAPASCSQSYHSQPNASPWTSPLVPAVAAEPAVSPGQLQAPEAAPEPTAGGPLSPPY